MSSNVGAGPSSAAKTDNQPGAASASVPGAMTTSISSKISMLHKNGELNIHCHP